MKKIEYYLFFSLILIISCKKPFIKPANFQFDFCKKCITVSDVINFETELGSKRIGALSDFEHVRIFKKNAVPDLAIKNSFNDSILNIYFLRKDTSINDFIVTCYSMSYVDSLRVLPLNKIIISSIKKKYFYHDSYFDSIMKHEVSKPYDIKLQRGLAKVIKDSLDIFFNQQGVKYEPLNLERSEDFPLKNEIYGIAWGSMKLGGSVEFNYTLNHSNKYKSRKTLQEKNMSVYFELNYFSPYLDSLRNKYNFPE